MNIPALTFGFMIASLAGAAFHLWQGGGLGRLLLYLVLAWVGFWVGHGIGGGLGWEFGRLGTLNLGMAVLGMVITLGLGYWLSLFQEIGEP
jgi:hypothetical protein